MAKKHISLTEWVRRVTGMDRQRSVAKKLDAIRVAAEHHFPTGDMDSMLAEVEQGYVGWNSKTSGRQ